MEELKVLTAPFAAGFVVQRFLEILDPLTTRFVKDPNTKKFVLGLVSLAIGWTLAIYLDLRIFHELLSQSAAAKLPDWLDHLSTGIFISAGTEGFNSLMKFANYKKEASKADAASKISQLSADQLGAVNS